MKKSSSKQQQQWYLLHRTQNLAQANIIKGMLEENQVMVILMNRQDSSYLNFGDIEVYVPAHLKDIARQLVAKALLN